MSQLCATTKCNRASRGVCDCCSQHLCIQHLSEHNALLISQLDPLTDEINALGDRLTTLNIEKVVSSSRQKLEEWRNDCHEKIDRFFKQKCQELDRLFDEQIKKEKEGIDQIRFRLAELIREQETTRQDIDTLTTTVRQLERNMDNIVQTSFTISTRPLLLDDTSVIIIKNWELDPSTLSDVYKTINCFKGGFTSLASNDRFLLIHQKPDLCLIDGEVNIVKRTAWSHNTLYDMCWSSTLNRFIIVEEQHIYLIDQDTMAMECVSTIEKRNWLSCTCSNTSLFLSTDENVSSVVKFRLLPSIELFKEWKSPHTCSQDETIHDILYNDKKLALMIGNKFEKSLCFDLRYAKTLDRIWSFRFDTIFNKNAPFRCCSLVRDEWLVADYETKCLLHITKDGKLKATIQYDPVPCAANLFANMLVVPRHGGVNFHKL